MRLRDVLRLKVGDLIELKNAIGGQMICPILGLSQLVVVGHEVPFVEIKVGVLGRYEYVTQWDVERKINPRPA